MKMEEKKSTKKIDINFSFVKMPVRITIDDVNYPITQHNLNVVRRYWENNDESELDKLSTVSLIF